jgi:hypothetical protein
VIDEPPSYQLHTNFSRGGSVLGEVSRPGPKIIEQILVYSEVAAII